MALYRMGKTKIKKLELEKLCITKCKLKELENENHKGNRKTKGNQ